MALQAYRSKRNFKRTGEPKGQHAKPGTKAGHGFVIQKHAARRLHYDLRLEMDGVLKSWAVPRGPGMVAGEKRLAVHVEDHPLDYGGFEGNIPEGEYGAGSVIVWDRGHWQPIGDEAKGYAKGHLEFELFGEKLKGRWHLVRMANRAGDNTDNWLLIKADDQFARLKKDPDILKDQPASVLTGRPIEALKGEIPGWSSSTGRILTQEPKSGLSDPLTLEGAKKAGLPDFVEPQLATLVTKPPAGERWIHEIKFDGYRLEVRMKDGRVRFLTRSGLDWTHKFGKALIEAFEELPITTALIDGELVVENQSGGSDFSALQADLSGGRTDRFVFYGFDLLYLDGIDLRSVPLLDRKRLLRERLDGQTEIRFSDHFTHDGALVLEKVCRLGLEGIVSKAGDAGYFSGRGKSWLKAKCSLRQEFVIIGYVPSTTSRHAIGSLALGLYEGGKLIPVGRVGTGFSDKVAQDLLTRLEQLRVDKTPLDAPLTATQRRGLRYVKPHLVAEVEFRAWTADGNIRHASFCGLREDKSPGEIIREAEPSKAGKNLPVSRIKLTHPDRIYWPDAGVTKAGMADYYSAVWHHIAPFVTGRPLALLRGPEGMEGQTFFQKHGWKGMDRNIRLVRDPEGNPEDSLLVIDDLDGLIALVQSGVLEIHPWGSRLKDLEHPDMIIMDLDPGENVGWRQLVEGAREVKTRLEERGLSAFVKTSGGKGLHVVAPLKPGADWRSVKAFTKAIADAMSNEQPDRYIATITKSKRHGKILVDYLRNGRGATAVAAYSTRARANAPVSMPLEWDELDDAIGPAWFTVKNAPARLASLKKDPWADFWACSKPLPKSGRK